MKRNKASFFILLLFLTPFLGAANTSGKEGRKKEKHIILRRSHITGSVEKPIYIPLIKRKPFYYWGEKNGAVIEIKADINKLKKSKLETINSE